MVADFGQDQTENFSQVLQSDEPYKSILYLSAPPYPSFFSKLTAHFDLTAALPRFVIAPAGGPVRRTLGLCMK